MSAGSMPETSWATVCNRDRIWSRRAWEGVTCDTATGQTGNPKVFAGGDCINGGKEVVNAVADGRNAARTLMARWQTGRTSIEERANG